MRVLYLVPFVLVACPSVGQVLTEGFEEPMTSSFIVFNAGSTITTDDNIWSVTSSGVDLYNGIAAFEADAFDGVQAVDLAGSPGAGVLETSFAVVVGERYRLIFHYARNNFIAGTSARAEVIGASPRLSATVAHAAPTAFGDYQRFDADFTADADTLVLRFTSLNGGNHGITIDAVSVVEALCDADLTGEGDVNVNDFFAFLALYQAMDPQADFAPGGGINVNDFFAFLAAYQQGC